MFKRERILSLFMAIAIAMLIAIINILILIFPGREDRARMPDELESLRALPYASWTKENADPALAGVTKYDVLRAYDGYNLYTNDVDKAYLMDMAGNILYEWQIAGKRHWEYAALLDEGEMLAVCEGESVAKIDRHSNLLWERRGRFNHDVARYGDGAMLVPIMEQARPYGEYGGVVFDALWCLPPSAGEVLWEWSTFEKLNLIQKYHPPSRLDGAVAAADDKRKKEKLEYYHLNAVEILPDTPLGEKDDRFRAGNILICLRNADLIMILDSETRNIRWAWGPGIVDYPHMPTMIENGNILVFDNGTRRGYSRIVELDPSDYKIVWEYLADPPEKFFSEWRGSNQRLPNGNTLICESEKGHIFEVTKGGEVVWEFWNPEIKLKKRKSIYRMMRYEKASIDAWLTD